VSHLSHSLSFVTCDFHFSLFFNTSCVLCLKSLFMVQENHSDFENISRATNSSGKCLADYPPGIPGGLAGASSLHKRKLRVVSIEVINVNYFLHMTRDLDDDDL